MEDLAGAQIKWRKLMIEEDKNTDELFLKHKTDEAQQTCEFLQTSKNREHELRLAQIYASVRPASFLSQGDQ